MATFLHALPTLAALSVALTLHGLRGFFRQVWRDTAEKPRGH